MTYLGEPSCIEMLLVSPSSHLLVLVLTHSPQYNSS